MGFLDGRSGSFPVIENQNCKARQLRCAWFQRVGPSDRLGPRAALERLLGKTLYISRGSLRLRKRSLCP
eukprot:6035804-Pleurochrysis_carterae.AAC.1